MKILIHGRNLELTEALKEYTSFKIKKAAKHYKDFVQETTGIVSGVHSQMVQFVKNFDGS